MVFVSKEGRRDFLVILDHQLNNLTKLFDTVDNTSPTTANNVSSGFFFFFFSSKKRMNDASFAYSNNKKNQAQACWVFKPTCLALPNLPAWLFFAFVLFKIYLMYILLIDTYFI
jgi:hypothetical protein